MKIIFSIIPLMLLACGSEKTLSFKGDVSKTGIYEADPSGLSFPSQYDSISYILKRRPSISASEFTLVIDEKCYANEICVAFKLTPKGTVEYEKLTKRNYDKQIFYVIDGRIISAPNVMGIIKSGNGQFPISKVDFDSLFIVN